VLPSSPPVGKSKRRPKDSDDDDDFASTAAVSEKDDESDGNAEHVDPRELEEQRGRSITQGTKSKMPLNFPNPLQNPQKPKVAGSRGKVKQQGSAQKKPMARPVPRKNRPTKDTSAKITKKNTLSSVYFIWDEAAS